MFYWFLRFILFILFLDVIVGVLFYFMKYEFFLYFIKKGLDFFYWFWYYKLIYVINVKKIWMYYCLVGMLYVGILYGIVRDFIFVLVCFDGFFSCLE